MKYENIVEGIFLSRPNRFIAEIEIDGKTEICHVMNTGRMKELLLPGAKVFLKKSENPKRKTKFDLISIIRSDGEIINIDSLAPNKVAHEYIEALFPNALSIKPETFFNKSRFDFYIETPKEKIFLEVKGVTLDIGGKACFPDAPTERGAKHLFELMEAKREGYRAMVLFVIAMRNCKSFMPNYHTDPKFANALKEARNAGVEVVAVDCTVSADEIFAKSKIPCEI